MDGMGERQPEEGILEFPSLDCVAELVSQRDFDWDRRVAPNDFSDIDFLSVAIPYTDVVVCERYFANKAIESGLAHRYGTRVYASVEEFAGDLATGQLGPEKR